MTLHCQDKVIQKHAGHQKFNLVIGRAFKPK